MTDVPSLVSMHVMMSPRLRDKIRQAARKADLTAAQWIRAAAWEKLARDEAPPRG